VNATRFALSYLHWLQRTDRTLHEPREPRPDEHGLPPERDSSGRITGENLLAEPLRLHVRQVWEAEVLANVRNRAAMQERV
jgi:hypothetical protein